MSKGLPDSDLDNLIRGAADDAGASSYREEDWVKMELLLEKDKRRRFFFWWWLAPALLLLGGAGFWWWKQHTTATTHTVTATQQSNRTVEEQPATTSLSNTVTESQTTTDIDNSQEASASSQATNNSSATVTSSATGSNQSTINGNTSTAKERTATSVGSGTSASGNTVIRSNTSSVASGATKNAIVTKGTTPATGKQRKTASQTSTLRTVKRDKQTFRSQNATPATAKNAVPAKSDAPIVDDPSATARLLESSQPTTVNKIATDKPADSVLKSDTALAKKADTLAKKDTVATKTKKEKKTKETAKWLSRFELSAFGTADYTSVKLRNEDQVSWGGGLAIGYAVSKRFSVAVGFGVSEKKYGARLADYKNPPTWGPRYEVDSNLTASCTVYEIPVLLQYNFINKGANHFFVTAGLSTYLMKREEYNYVYYYYGNEQHAMLEYKNQNKHVLSILSLSVGYRRQFNRKFAVQFAPFIKIPLSGVGQGRVNLYSAGLQLSAHWRPWGQ